MGDLKREASSSGRERLFSLDVLRGLDMLVLVVIVPVLCAIDSVWGLPAGLMAQLRHPWEGFTFYDFIMPLFIFVCGAAIPLSLERRLARSGGRADFGYWRHVLLRVAMLWILGMLVQGRLLSLDLDRFRLYNNTLQAIAVGYLAVACAILIPSAKARMLVPVGCFVVYGLLLHCFGDYSLNGNVAAKFDQNLLMSFMPATSEMVRMIQKYGILCDQSTLSAQILEEGAGIHYAWYLPSLMCAFMSFCGYYATKILQAGVPAWTRARNLFAYGLALLALGLVLEFAGVKLIKHIYTVSFTAQAMGWSALLFAALYVLVDVWRLRSGLGLVVLFGQFALTAYLMEDLFKPALVALAEIFCAGLPHLLGTDGYQPFAVAVLVAAEIVVALRVRRALAAKANVQQCQKQT